MNNIFNAIVGTDVATLENLLTQHDNALRIVKVDNPEQLRFLSLPRSIKDGVKGVMYDLTASAAPGFDETVVALAKKSSSSFTPDIWAVIAAEGNLVCQYGDEDYVISASAFRDICNYVDLQTAASSKPELSRDRFVVTSFFRKIRSYVRESNVPSLSLVIREEAEGNVILRFLFRESRTNFKMLPLFLSVKNENITNWEFGMDYVSITGKFKDYTIDGVKVSTGFYAEANNTGLVRGGISPALFVYDSIAILFEEKICVEKDTDAVIDLAPIKKAADDALAIIQALSGTATPIAVEAILSPLKGAMGKIHYDNVCDELCEKLKTKDMSIRELALNVMSEKRHYKGRERVFSDLKGQMPKYLKRLYL